MSCLLRFLVVTMALVSFLHCLLVCVHVTVSLLINDQGKSNLKKKKLIIKTLFYLVFLLLPSFTASQPVTLPCSVAHLDAHLYPFFLSHLCLVTLYHFQPHSKLCSCFLLALALVHTSLTLLLFPQCFHTSSPFKPFVLHFFVMLHFTLALCHTCSIFSVLSLNSWGYICSAA